MKHQYPSPSFFFISHFSPTEKPCVFNEPECLMLMGIITWLCFHYVTPYSSSH
uniref:Uncharacterized protein n=1 Tax=Anguilla anguilla TaxID=7936 RepID=A0A0E9U9Q5_ANGAN